MAREHWQARARRAAKAPGAGSTTLGSQAEDRRALVRWPMVAAAHLAKEAPGAACHQAKGHQTLQKLGSPAAEGRADAEEDRADAEEDREGAEEDREGALAQEGQSHSLDATHQTGLVTAGQCLLPAALVQEAATKRWVNGSAACWNAPKKITTASKRLLSSKAAGRYSRKHQGRRHDCGRRPCRCGRAVRF